MRPELCKFAVNAIFSVTHVGQKKRVKRCRLQLCPWKCNRWFDVFDYISRRLLAQHAAALAVYVKRLGNVTRREGKYLGNKSISEWDCRNIYCTTGINVYHSIVYVAKMYVLFSRGGSGL